jgi:hypothetical protein
LCLALQPKRSQAIHVFNSRFPPRTLLLESHVYFGFPTLIFIKRGFGHFAVFCVHDILPGGVTRQRPRLTRSSIKLASPISKPAIAAFKSPVEIAFGSVEAA